MLLDDCLSSLNTAFLLLTLHFSFLCCLFGFNFYFSAHNYEIRLFHSPSNGHFCSHPQAPWSLTVHSCCSIKFVSANLHTDISLKGLCPPSSILSISFALLLPALHVHDIPKCSLCSSSWVDTVYAIPVQLPSCLWSLDQAIQCLVLKQPCSFHWVSHPRLVSLQALQILKCIQDNTYPRTSPIWVNQQQLWVLTGMMLSVIPGRAFSSSTCSTGILLHITFWLSIEQQRVTYDCGLCRYFLVAQQQQDSGAYTSVGKVF